MLNLNNQIGLWQYEPGDGLWYFEGGGEGVPIAEVERLELEVEAHEERKRRRIAERNEY